MAKCGQKRIREKGILASADVDPQRVAEYAVRSDKNSGNITRGHP